MAGTGREVTIQIGVLVHKLQDAACTSDRLAGRIGRRLLVCVGGNLTPESGCVTKELRAWAELESALNILDAPAIPPLPRVWHAVTGKGNVQVKDYRQTQFTAEVEQTDYVR